MRTKLPPQRRQPRDAAPDRKPVPEGLNPAEPQVRSNGSIAAGNAKDRSPGQPIAGPMRKRRKPFVL
jgi:hypothetical protein